ncbi:hypothetical protein [Chryseobacterium sp. CFS15]|uniref:hypothetical protein n=1 Tax=Chryseobacterium sp. CFS15 TaxID=2986946 RepID=UPI0028065DDC|nr:hypothetical protein [Chryseobacterium sp. CFS15]MDQ8140570.1 hypothetical protein [Chryseobacterium sp. CFS15]
MKKIKTILFLGFGFVASAATFALTINDSSLESLRANAGIKCVEATNSDCRSASTGQIYTGYKAQTIGGTSSFEEESL